MRHKLKQAKEKIGTKELKTCVKKSNVRVFYKVCVVNMKMEG